ncbi:DUF3288 family protein [Geitlerinema sp. PCC 9228]|jgi:hypothetical protein|uniref:DUF3288 family protein n=1 Tax=Geitlerinema sp. PCC 9228 TaxID=111611 RepID=UPI0008F9D538|nr:DUF3288 family protein [Geitlerinema sp. PCC 9228]
MAEEQRIVQHPQEKSDRAMVASLLNSEPTSYNLAEAARLRIRYEGFPGAKEIKQELDTLLQNWQLTEEELFAKTREIHWSSPVYNRRNQDTQEDWI